MTDITASHDDQLDLEIKLNDNWKYEKISTAGSIREINYMKIGV